MSWTWDSFLFSCSSSCFLFFSSFSFFFAVFSFFLISNLPKQTTFNINNSGRYIILSTQKRLGRVYLDPPPSNHQHPPSFQDLSLLNSVEKFLLSFLLRHLLQPSSVLCVSHQIIVVTILEDLVLGGVRVGAGRGAVALRIWHLTWRWKAINWQTLMNYTDSAVQQLLTESLLLKTFALLHQLSHLFFFYIVQRYKFWWLFFIFWFYQNAKSIQ